MVTAGLTNESRPGLSRFVPRFSLRALMLMVLILGVICARFIVRANAQRDGVAAIERSGGQVWYDWQHKNGQSVPGGKPRGPRWLVNRLGIHYFDTVTSADYFLFPKPATDHDLARIGQLGGLEDLAIRVGDISDAGIAELDGLSNLQCLTIISDDADLIDRFLRRTRLLARLEWLNLNSPAVSDEHLQYLKSLTNLEMLNLQDSCITDDGLSNLRGLTNLHYLFLNNTKITDRGLKHLESLTNLKEVRIKGTGISSQGANRLRRALPNLRISP